MPGQWPRPQCRSAERVEDHQKQGRTSSQRQDPPPEHRTPVAAPLRDRGAGVSSRPHIAPQHQRAVCPARQAWQARFPRTRPEAPYDQHLCGPSRSPPLTHSKCNAVNPATGMGRGRGVAESQFRAAPANPRAAGGNYPLGPRRPEGQESRRPACRLFGPLPSAAAVLHGTAKSSQPGLTAVGPPASRRRVSPAVREIA